MELGTTYKDWVILPLSGIAGTYICYVISMGLQKFRISHMLSFVGANSVWIFVLHLLCFKVTELLEVRYYHLPIQMVGCHTVIPPMDNWFWIIHTCSGVGIPILIALAYQSIKVYAQGKKKN